MLHINLIKIGPVVFEMLTDEDGRQPKAIGHLSYSVYINFVDYNVNRTP